MKIIAANWKLHKNPAQARSFCKDLHTQIGAGVAGTQVVLFPTAFCVPAVADAVAGTSVQWGAQHCATEVSGALTGENSAQVVGELGGRWILIGHSERRSLFGESDATVLKKALLAQKLNLIPMICIGETLQEREAGQTNSRLTSQLKSDLIGLDVGKEVSVAYEPVWAIGTGKVASPAQVAEAHAHIAQILSELGFPKSTKILYGGSVKPDNAAELAKLPHVDGFLIGGASLEVPSLTQIIRASANGLQ